MTEIELQYNELGQNYILDEDKIIRKKDFCMIQLDEDTFAYGKLIPKIIDVTNKKNEVVARTQELKPALLISKSPYLIDPENKSLLESYYKLKVVNIPTELDLGMSLSTIKSYVEGLAPNINSLKLFNRIRKQYETYCYFNQPVWYIINTLWDIGTYFFKLFRYYPIREIRGLKGTGKTSKNMTISSLISFNSTGILINPSESSIFRETNDKIPTKYIDEAEKLFRFEKGRIVNSPIIELINSSYYYKGSVPRVEKVGDKFKVIYYKTFSPTCVASINGLFGATEDRAIIQIMTKNPNEDKRGELQINENDFIWQELRDDLHFFALQNWKKVKTTYETLENDTTLKGRDYELWKPLLSLAKIFDNKIYEQVKTFAEKTSETKSYNNISDGSKEFLILSTIKDLLDSGKDEILIKDVSSNLNLTDKPSNKSLGTYIDKFGFLDFKHHTRQGNGYSITSQLFEDIIKPICPQLFASHSSYSSHSDDNLVKLSEEYVKNVKNNDTKKDKCEECDSREAEKETGVFNNDSSN